MPAAEFLSRLRVGSPLRPSGSSSTNTTSSSSSNSGSSATQQQLLTTVAYSPNEYCYMQAEVPPDQLQSLRWAELVSELQQAASAGGGGAAAPAPSGSQPPLDPQSAAPPPPIPPSSPLALPPAARLAQPPRVWISPAGAVSPLHYDTSHSFLVQLAGAKRMLLLDPDQLPCSHPYAGTHLLRRRGRVNVCAPDFER
jgi:hypothetical protein